MQGLPGGWHFGRNERSEPLQHAGVLSTSHPHSSVVNTADPHRRSPHDSLFRQQLELAEKADWRHELAELEKADQKTLVDLLRYDRPKGSHPAEETWKTQGWRPPKEEHSLPTSGRAYPSRGASNSLTRNKDGAPKELPKVPRIGLLPHHRPTNGKYKGQLVTSAWSPDRSS
eukprot:gnl/MRDRNA2_/MRDRNA2_119203_c0_seq1.p1 gnl/MRDRNA2_/MRDRNA2_119203_c0~~gnl/MRDRNA2_/MRDRNA2_119203_c0_seq1.p1  ORF type:complete len:172 (-),score=12.65 gnl/MRDRNA2_/MRDRNA2_119203_c0_seq1:41-556(-)